ncbi:hypothetical protein H8356DRAFT_893477, partial [Neocallimastix lanati (nom. inval.)]|uniref:Uncharacterized protein n=1 Tax=Neocallimastix californiae TaxID=1754190 RepID=A0A1Y2A2B7_9FUNG|eukprot:ORY16659.1 hypothetical protein LY90DRAFT_517707 [Neocallimastix californiae]
MKPGIGIVAEAGFDIIDFNGNVMKPEQYAVKSTDGNKIINSENIESKYDVKNNVEYDMNLVKEEALDLNTINNDIKINHKKYDINDLMINLNMNHPSMIIRF